MRRTGSPGRTFPARHPCLHRRTRSTSCSCKSSLLRSASRKRPITCNCSARPSRPAAPDRRHADHQWKVEGAVGQISPRGTLHAAPERPGTHRRRTGGPPRGNPGRSRRGPRRLRAQLPPRRRARALARGLQRRHVPRRGQGQERLQALAARLRPDRRSSRPDRRPCRAADQHGLARRQPDAAQADGRRAAPGRARVRGATRPTTAPCTAGSPRAPSSIFPPPAWRRSTFSPKTP